jgi:hypothetical protein
MLLQRKKLEVDKADGIVGCPSSFVTFCGTGRAEEFLRDVPYRMYRYDEEEELSTDHD